MLNKIIYYSLHNRLVVLICSLLLMIAGTYTAFHTDVDVFPDLNAPTVVIMTEANGMAPEEVERLVTFPVETAVNGAMDVRRVRSSSTTGFSVVWVEFDWGTDIYRARQIVSEKLAVVSESLPENVGKPTLGPQSSILGEMMIIGLTVDETSESRDDSRTTLTTQMDLRTIADWTIRPRLLSTGGVAQVAVIGGDIKEYQILLDPARMKHYGVSLGEVLTVTRNMNRNANGGVLYEYDNEYIIRGVLSTANAEEIGKGVVKTVGDFPVLLENIATVKIGSKSPKLGTASERAKPAVLITVTKQPNTSTIDLTEKLDAIMGSGGLVVMDENTCMVEVARFFMNFTQRESCGKCVPCREGTKRMLEILERIVDGKGEMSDLDELEELANMVQNMALCGLGKSAPLPVISTLKRFRNEYEEHIRDKKCRAALRQFHINPEFCIGCGKCAKNCPAGAISGKIKHPYHIDNDICIKCGACKDNCNFDAVYVEA